MPSAWNGVFPALTTPFAGDLAIDHTALARHLERLISAGIDGVVMAGSLGEHGSLTEDERQAVLETALGTSAGRIPVTFAYTSGSGHRRAADAINAWLEAGR